MSDKKGFTLMFDEWPILMQLPDAQLAKLIRAIAQYTMTGEVVTLPPLANMAFLSIKGRLERDEAVRAKKSAAGKKGMESRYGKKEEPSNDITGDNTTTTDISTPNISVTDSNSSRQKAYELWQQGRQIKDISAELGVSQPTVSSWKRRDKWEVRQNDKETNGSKAEKA